MDQTAKISRFFLNSTRTVKNLNWEILPSSAHLLEGSLEGSGGVQEGSIKGHAPEGSVLGGSWKGLGRVLKGFLKGPGMVREGSGNGMGRVWA